MRYDTNQVINRLRGCAGCKTDLDLCKFMGLGKPTISAWRARDGVNFDTIFDVLNEKLGGRVSLDWLFYGEGSMERGGVAIHSGDNSGVIAGHDVDTGAVEALAAQLSAKDEQIEKLHSIILNLTQGR